MDLTNVSLDAAIQPGDAGSSRSNQVASAIIYWNAIVAGTTDPAVISYANTMIGYLNLEAARLNDPLSHPDAQV